MIEAMIYFCAFYFIFHLSILLWLAWGRTQMTSVPTLEQVKSRTTWPKVSIIVPARNEERTIAVGLESLLNFDYPNYEILVVNDRSTDQTKKIIESFQKKSNQIRLIDIENLPEGWLGKNHAMHVGTQSASGELILFSDADVQIEKTFLKKMVRLMELNQLDHVTSLPGVTAEDWKLPPVIGVFGLGFTLFVSPWLAKNPKSKSSVGIGAFNLIRRNVYDAIGGHTPIRFRPDDDLKLAELVKKKGYRTDCVSGTDSVVVEWYPNIRSLAVGLEKNAMTGFRYQISLAIIGLSVHFFTFVFPFILPFIAEGRALWLALGAMGFLWCSYLAQLRENRLPLWCLPLLPFATSAMFLILTRACLLTFIRKGIYWRGTFYSLNQLKEKQ